MFEFRIPGSPGHAWDGDVLTIGRDSSNGWVLARPGVWARHAEIHRGIDGRLTIRSLGDAVVTLNGVPTRESILHWGDSVGFGATVGRPSRRESRPGRCPQSKEWSVTERTPLVAVQAAHAAQ